MRLVTSFVFLACVLFAENMTYDFHESKTQEEALHLRRILEFWEEGDYEIAKNQIEDFLTMYPDNFNQNILLAVLGDLYKNENNYAKAATIYGNIQDHNVHQKIFIHQLECYYQLEWYLTLAEESESHLEIFSRIDSEKYLEIKRFLAEALYKLTFRSPKDSNNFTTYAQKAKKYFESLLDTKFKEQVERPLADIYSILDEYQNAADLYMSLAEKKLNIKEDLLFKAASLQMEFDKEQAIQTFGQICHLGKNKKKLAAYNRMILFFETERYAEIILAKDQLMQLIPKEKKGLLHFLLGHSHFILEDYKRTINELDTYIATSPLSTEKIHDAYLKILESHFQLEDIDEFNKSLLVFQQEFPQSEETPKIFARRGDLYIKLDNVPKAKTDFEYILTHYPDYKNRETLLYNFSSILYKEKLWQESRDQFFTFLTDYPDSNLTSVTWRFFINASNEAYLLDTKEKGNQLIADLEIFLEKNELLTHKEFIDYTYQLAKCCYDIEDFTSSIFILDNLKEQNMPENRLSEVYHLLANCFRLEHKDLRLFCTFAQKALQINPEKENRASIYLALYNSYLKRYNDEGGNGLLLEAANNLYEACNIGCDIKENNIRWLIDFHFDQVTDYLKSNWKNTFDQDPQIKNSLDKTEVLLQNLLTKSSNPLILESANLKLATAYRMQKNYKEAIDLLEQQSIKYQKSSNVEWLLEKRVQLELANIYYEAKNLKKALYIYEDMLKDNPLLQFKIPAEAALQSARILYESLNKNFLKPDNLKIIKVLTRLKDLTIQKHFTNEPIHLEAALEYIDIQNSIQSNKSDARLKLINMALDNFLLEEDVLSKEYHHLRSQNPEKKQLFESYISLFQIDKLLTETSIFIESQQKDEAKISFEKALDQYNNALKSAVNEYVHKKLMIFLSVIETIQISFGDTLDSYSSEKDIESVSLDI